MGGGFEIVLACDLAVSVPSARFGLPEVKHGLIAAGVEFSGCPNNSRRRIASEILLTGRIFPATETLRWRLVNAVAPEPVLDDAFRMPYLIAKNGPIAVQATKPLNQATIGACRGGPGRRSPRAGGRKRFPVP